MRNILNYVDQNIADWKHIPANEILSLKGLYDTYAELLPATEGQHTLSQTLARQATDRTTKPDMACVSITVSRTFRRNSTGSDLSHAPLQAKTCRIPFLSAVAVTASILPAKEVMRDIKINNL